jgi:hypothetical protein
MLVTSLLPTREAADRVRRHADLLGDESEEVERHDLALAQDAARIPKDAKLQREGEPRLRGSVAAHDFDILAAE